MCGSTCAAPSSGVSRFRFSDVFADGDPVDRRDQQPITALTGGCTASFEAAHSSTETAAEYGHFAGSSRSEQAGPVLPATAAMGAGLRRQWPLELWPAPPDTPTVKDANVDSPLKGRHAWTEYFMS